ncbi:MAG: hypothetical protein H7288_10660 [Kineosporiaceae bacterium]|nr:hypothetical protein [Aeromicrobium sp.]
MTTISLALIVSAFGAVAVTTVIPAAAASVANPSDSKLTVMWTGDTSSASNFQPSRQTSSPHYKDFKNLSISVAQTTGIIDQAIRVRVAGFAGTKSQTLGVSNAQNFLQAMQCWGDDPKAADFYKTCQWGGRNSSGTQTANDVYRDNLLRVAPKYNGASSASTVDNPFVLVSGKVIPGKEVIVDGVNQYPILNYFSPSTTNEVSSARVGADGTGFFDFETQSSDQAPQLGCGTAQHLRCWLVIVPRGSHFGGLGADGFDCSDYADPKKGYRALTYGQSNSLQGGSPVNPKCDYFNNRVVIPLDFTPTGVTCPVGGSEFRLSGSQLMVGAMSSWQPSLCQNIKSTFSFATNPDSIARSNLIGTSPSSPQLTFSSYPVSSEELQTENERSDLAIAKIAYAPVAISSVVLAFNAEFPNGRQERLVITPRLMAKLLTQSYPFTVPSSTGDPDKTSAHLSTAARKYSYWNSDPDFRKANPENYRAFDQQNPSIVLPGPSGADAIRQVWRWILADKDAVSFLDGNADPDGMTINPYYLPKGDPKAVVPWYFDEKKNYIDTPVQRQVGLTNLDGSPQKLSSLKLDLFPKDDESLLPFKLGEEKSRFDTIQFSPYAVDFLAAARQTFRGDPNSRTLWDSTKQIAAGEFGAWVSTGVQAPGSKFMITVIDSNSAARYGMSTAAVTVPNSNTPVESTNSSMSAALVALKPTGVRAVQQVDPSAIPSDGYPMTIVTYAAVNMSKTTDVSRPLISKMLRQVTTSGQVPGSEIGELPSGYLPLTDGLKAQGEKAAADVAAFVPTVITDITDAPPSVDSAPYATDDYVGPVAIRTASVTGAPASTGTGAGTGATDPVISANDNSANAGDMTPASSAGPIERSGLFIALAVGLLGFLVAPVFLRRRFF